MIKKVIAFAALALTLAACNKAEVLPVEKNDGMITITATLAPKSAATKGLADNGDGKLKASWEEGEKLAILYDVDGTRHKSVAEVIYVEESGEAWIEFSVNGGTTDRTACTVIYPAGAAKDDASGVQSNAELIGNQSGTLNPLLDVRVTTGRIKITFHPRTPVTDLVLDAPLAPQFAIVKFTLRNTESSPISAKSLVVTIGNDAFVATPGSAASEFYLALPAVSSGTLIFSVPGDTGTSSYCSSKTGITLQAGKYYRSTLSMAVQSTAADYVPMGDGLNWALQNVRYWKSGSAGSAADYGDYFAWGDIAPYYSEPLRSDVTRINYWIIPKLYIERDYRFGSGGGGGYFTKYSRNDNLLELESVDDAAYATSSGKFRMPTKTDWEALLKAEDFTWAWVTNFNGGDKNGRLVISKKSGFEGHSIFLPAAGRIVQEARSGAGYYGYYWSSSLDSRDWKRAHVLYFDLWYWGGAYWELGPRYLGYPVRGVLSE